MNIEKNVKNDITIISLQDKLNTTTAPIVEKFINNELDNNINKIILDLIDLQYISSAGLRIFLSTAKKIESNGGKLGICNLNDVIKEIFNISGFITIFNVYNSLDEAIADF